MALLSICSSKNSQYPVKHQEKLNQQDIPDSLKYTLTKKFLDLIEYQSTLFTPEEMECYYNEYSSKILNRMLERKIMRDNCPCGSVCEGGEGGSSVLNENRGLNNDLRKRHISVPAGKQINARRATNEQAKRPPTIEEELNETIASRTRNARNKIQQTANTHGFNRNRDQIKHDDNEKQRLQVANKKLREPGKQTRLVADYSTNSSSFVFCTPMIPQKSSRKIVSKQFKKPEVENEIRTKRKREEQHYRDTEEVSDEYNDSDIDDLRLY